MLQPFEAIPATVPIVGDLLSLEDAALQRRTMMIALAQHLRRATLVGNPAPIVQRMDERLRSPQLGDLVIETSRALGGRDPDIQMKGFGILIEQRREWACTDTEWEAERQEYGPDDPRPTDQAWYVLYGPRPEDVCRWTNCDFMTIPVVPRMFDVPVGTVEQGRVVLTRDDLLGSLGDSGFRLRSTTRGEPVDPGPR